MRLSYDEIKADRTRMEKFICTRISGDVTRIDLGGGAWADLYPSWDDEVGWSLLLETDEPEWVDLWEVYQHFRRKEMTTWEWWQEFDREMAKGKIFDLEKENAVLRHGVEAEMLVRLERIEGKLDGVVGTSKPAPDYSSIKQAARITGLSESHVRRAVVAGELPASNIGSASHPTYRIALKDLHEWMNNKKGGTAKVPPKSIIDDLIQRHLPGLRGRKDSATR